MLGGCTVSVARGARPFEVILALTGAQRGRVARWQLAAAGLTRDAIDRSVRSGRLVAEYHAVYALAGTGELPLAAETAAVLAGGPGSRLSFHSAAVLWKLRPGVARPVHITVPHHRRGPTRQPGIVVHRTTIQVRGDVHIHRGLPVTSPARTTLDVAATLPDADVARLLDEALFARRLLSRRELLRTLATAGGHPGRARLRRAAAPLTRPARPDSKPEARLLALISAAGLPAPQTQAPILGYRLDLYWPDRGFAVEVDTYGTHGSPRRFAADRRKDARLLAERGIVVLRFTDTQIASRPFEVVALLARSLT